MRQASAADSQDPNLHRSLAEMFRSAGLLDEALAASQRALALGPHSPKALHALGNMLCARKEYEAALSPLRRATTLAPDFVSAHVSLGKALRALGRLDEALQATDAAISLEPKFPDAFYGRGLTLHQLGRFEEAEADWKHALALDPAHMNARKALIERRGIALYRMGEFDAAEAHWKQEIARRPTDADAHTYLAFSYLLRGKLSEGFALYEWRSLRKDIKHAPQLAPSWEGDDPSGRRLLIHAEQGFGDTLQFCRYLPLLQERGARPVFLVPRHLQPLIAHSMPWLDVQSDPTLPFDIQAGLLSLPHLLKTTLDTIPAPIPYIHAPPQAASRLGAVIDEDDGLKVGLAWAGSPRHFRDKDRSVAFAALAPILAVKGVRFFSLQLGAAAREASASLTDLALELTDFAQTAGAIANLDLVISVDTAVAHLAGAMGKRVWIMLPFVPDWRWLLEREDSPWYPTARLFRQKTRGDWGPVIGEIAAMLPNEHALVGEIAPKPHPARA
jgi:tetratricopeptide (TPR) repeat protein